MKEANDTSDSAIASYNEVSFGKYGECEKPAEFLLFLRIIMLGLYFDCAFNIFSSMFITCRAVYGQERTLKRYLRTIHGGNGTSTGSVNDIHNPNGARPWDTLQPSSYAKSSPSYHSYKSYDKT
eukprot:CAMPEP_0203635658 /NCGR_PEP_ID=MMETSP0088-20131115/2412_1 /ASSEMBLY_ACC=CAM_ASM_001087 /TAXON_ID=426623 /ORGANISM="Chaetoceros affinis, Strain CCMP159" /LENGTH=123 /DNA_ID=CAMNT_0050489617 /DNA_START=86 /DNA_END=457 /DNA_ORIENTATION=+